MATVGFKGIYSSTGVRDVIGATGLQQTRQNIKNTLYHLVISPQAPLKFSRIPNRTKKYQ